jgi:hypothetical protein
MEVIFVICLVSNYLTCPIKLIVFKDLRAMFYSSTLLFLYQFLLIYYSRLYGKRLMNCGYAACVAHSMRQLHTLRHS